MTKRHIGDILSFRQDISPFLVHLTKNLKIIQVAKVGKDGKPPSPAREKTVNAKSILEEILSQKLLRPQNSQISDARFGGKALTDLTGGGYFSSVCFTETPLTEIHNLFEIESRGVNLEPYGLVFIKENLICKNVSPALYINNTSADQDKVFEALYSLIETHPDAAKKFLPLISVFGKKIKRPSDFLRSKGDVNFSWEREWRFPAALGEFVIEIQDVFVGLCPHEEIGHFEKQFPDIKFIDPRYSPKYYASTLIERRKTFEIDYSVV